MAVQIGKKSRRVALKPATALLMLLLSLTSSLYADGQRMSIVARDLRDMPLNGCRFSYNGVESRPTSRAGATDLDLPPALVPGQQIKVHLVSCATQMEWFLITSMLNVPAPEAPAELVLMLRSEMRQIAAETRDAFSIGSDDGRQMLLSDSQKALLAAAGRHGLKEEQVEKALKAFAETAVDLRDRGIAAYLAGEYRKAETFLDEAAQANERDLVRTLRYLGSAQYLQKRFSAAANTLKKVVTLDGGDPAVLYTLGASLIQIGSPKEASQYFLDALALEEATWGKDHPNLARALNRAAYFLGRIDRVYESELFTRRALAIQEAHFGTNSPEVITYLYNLASRLIGTNRLWEAEILLRRAMMINEQAGKITFHSNHEMLLNSLADLYQKLGCMADAEPLLRRALELPEKHYGKNHPNVIGALHALTLFLLADKRPLEAEPLVNRLIVITESISGTNSLGVSSYLFMLAEVLQQTDRSDQANDVKRRALDIFSKKMATHDLDPPLFLPLDPQLAPKSSS